MIFQHIVLGLIKVLYWFAFIFSTDYGKERRDLCICRGWFNDLDMSPKLCHFCPVVSKFPVFPAWPCRVHTWSTAFCTTLFSKLNHVWVHKCVWPFTHTFPGVLPFFHAILSDLPGPTLWTEALKNHFMILRKVQFYCLLFHSCITASAYLALLYDFLGSNGNKNWELCEKARVWEWGVF